MTQIHQTVRVELDGDYALLWPEMRHKTTAALQRNLRKYMKPRGKPILLSEITPDTNLISDYEVDVTSFDQYEQNDIKLLNQVVEWSFGEVTQGILDNIPPRKYDKLVAEVDKLYAEVPLPAPVKPA